MKFEQYSRLAFRLNIFRFLAIVIIQKFVGNLKKGFHKFVELVEMSPLTYNTLLFDQYSRLFIRLNIFRFSAINSTTNLKKSLPLLCRARWDESIHVKHQRFRIKTKSWSSFEVRGTDRQAESISECTLKDLSKFNDIWHAYQSWKLVDDEEKNIPPSLH